jgi:ABC-type bacteriocin/lantibiotic exporter with double-glycine peptidase domain
MVLCFVPFLFLLIASFILFLCFFSLSHAKVSIVAQAAIVLVVWYGGQLVINSQMNTGDLLSFLLYTLTVAASIAVLSNSFGEYAGAVGMSEDWKNCELLLWIEESIA